MKDLPTRAVSVRTHAVRRVVVLNNYSLERVRREVAKGEKPAHHLYGVDEIERAGFQVELVPELAGPGWLRTLGRWLVALKFPLQVGDLGQQWGVWRNVRRGDLLYAPCQTQLQLLSYLRAFGLFKFPIVTLAHHPNLRGRMRWLQRGPFRLQLRGTDRFPSLSQAIAGEIREYSGRSTIAQERFAPVLQWGPHLAYYDKFVVAGPGSVAIAAGRTGRDWATFAFAAEAAGVPSQIYCLASEVRGALAHLSPNVRLFASASETDLPYSKLLPAMAAARVLAIPLLPGKTLAGLTSLTDALGLGKPVIMTRHPLIDIDIEREGIGHWVGSGDVQGWAEALRWFDAHPAEATAMGQRARALAETKWNSQLFGRQIVSMLENASGETPAGTTG